MHKHISFYFKKFYGQDIEIKDFENRNLCFDTVLSDRNINLFVEYKSRFFTSGENENFLYQNDVLIELVQTLPYFSNRATNKNINNLYSSYAVNTALGWFYKCSADRLIYFRFLDKILYDVIDIDFRLFKPWLMNNIGKYKLQYSGKTTGTINLKMPIQDIPQPMLLHKVSKFYAKVAEN